MGSGMAGTACRGVECEVRLVAVRQVRQVVTG